MATEHGHGPVNFDMLVEHYCVAFQGDPDAADRSERQSTFRSMLADFESNEGRVKSQYWCSNIQAAAVLTDRDHLFSAGDPYRTSVDLPLARLVGRADTFARVTEELLTGAVRRTSLELIYAIQTNALACMDELASTPAYLPPKAADMRKVTAAKIRDDLAIAQDYLEGAMGRAARLIYLQGVLLGITIVGAFVFLVMVLFAVFPNNFVAGTEFVPSILVFGALGAAVSVMQRLTQGNLRVRLEPGASAVRLLGAFRPIIGAVLALAILALVLGGLIPLAPPSDPAQRAFFLAGLAFLSGFSERYAQDMLGAGKTASPGANTLGPDLAE